MREVASGGAALARVLDGVDRETAAKNSGMERQTLRDWVRRCNSGGLAGLANRKGKGRPPKLTAAQMAAFKQIVEAGPDLAVDKVVRWRCADLKRVLAERFAVAGLVSATPLQVALAWLLHRSPNILLIPGTSQVAHLHQNLAAAELTLPSDALARLDAIGAGKAGAVYGPAHAR